MKLSHTVILSLLGHGIVLLPWSETADIAFYSTPSSYQVTLLETTVKQKNDGKNPTFDQTSVKTPNTSKPLKSPAKKNNKNFKKTEKASVSSSLQESEMRAHVISNINRKLKNHFTYPLLARRNGWQGKVVLGLSVSSQGNISNVHIRSGSGYRTLDQSALNALLKIRQVRRYHKWIDGDDLDIIIPVIYRLQKG